MAISAARQVLFRRARRTLAALCQHRLCVSNSRLPYFGTVPVLSSNPITYASLTDNFRGDLGVGAVVAAGARMRLSSRFSLSPEVRYTRWGSADTRLASNQAQLLVGLTF